MMAQIRTAMLAPTARKLPPIFNLSQLAGLVRN
jgi:chromosome partitioning protein